MQLQLTSEEAALLVEIFTGYVGDLRMEIADTDSLTFKDGLKKKEATLKSILQRLSTPS